MLTFLLHEIVVIVPQVGLRGLNPLIPLSKPILLLLFHTKTSVALACCMSFGSED